MFAHVAVQAGGPTSGRPYTYRVPEGVTAGTGQCVVVHFGQREELGYILALTDSPETPRDLQPTSGCPAAPDAIKTILQILETPPVFDRATANLLCWVSRHYVCSLADAMKCIVSASRLASVRTTVVLTGQPGPGRKLSSAAAAVIERLEAVGGEAEISQLHRAVPPPRLSEALRQLARRGQVQVLRTLLQKSETRTRLALRLSASTTELEAWLAANPRKKKPAEILKALIESPDSVVSQALLINELGCTVPQIQKLMNLGLVERLSVPVRRNPWPDAPELPLSMALTTHQEGALDVILAAVRRSRSLGPIVDPESGMDDPLTSSTLTLAGRPEVVLLRGVTGSGKTEVYLQAIEETVKAGRQSIALVPEISLTAQMIGIFNARFPGRVAILHSQLTPGEKLDEWQRIREGKVDVVIGARSALFAPVPSLGLIVLDEEHENSYKQDNCPYYQARDAAIERARLTGSCVILASATPCLESAWMTEVGQAHLAMLPTRIDDRPLPQVFLVDQRLELKENPGRLFSRRLTTALELRLARGEQAILFLNRKGFATITLCRDCGYVAHCKNCAVSLTYYSSSRLLRCHHCGYSTRAPDLCPQCSGVRLKQFGIGTEKVEEEIRSLFPRARVARLDTQSTVKKGSAQHIISRFQSGQIDILIGTQMLAKGFDFPGVTLVGVVSADTMLNLPDFRAAERTFQLLTQVSGRAGRGDKPGEVIVQTFNPDHYAIRAAAAHDFDQFRASEMELRRESRYPPFTRLANLVIQGAARDEASDRADRIADCLRSRPHDITLLGPAPAPLTRIKNRFRWHILLKAEHGADLREACQQMVTTIHPDDLAQLTVDLDPMSLL